MWQTSSLMLQQRACHPCIAAQGREFAAEATAGPSPGAGELSTVSKTRQAAGAGRLLGGALVARCGVEPVGGKFEMETDRLRTFDMAHGADLSPTPVRGSLDQTCGSVAPFGCWCDAGCEETGDCCADIGVCPRAPGWVIPRIWPQSLRRGYYDGDGQAR